MQTFEYKGYDLDGAAKTGHLQAASIEEVERKMLNQQITLVYVRPSKKKSVSTEPGASSGIRPKKRRRINDAEAAKILSSLAAMVNAGVPFVEALDAVAATAVREATIEGIQQVKTHLIEGRSLTEALRSAKTLFPELVADMVSIAEEGGSLGTSLASAGALMDRAATLRRKVANAMLYPGVMLSVSFVTVLVLVVVVMPRFADVFQQMHADIPATTKFLIDMGVLIRTKPWLCLGGAVLFFTVIRYALRNEAVNGWVASIALRMPGIGDLLNKLALSRSLQAIAALISVNVPVVEALQHGARVAGHRKLSAAIHRSLDRIQEGETLFAAFSQNKIFPPTITQMIGVGERTGNLGSMITTCAAEIESDADARLKSLISIIEPLLIVVMGLVVGTITVSIILPIYAAVQNVR